MNGPVDLTESAQRIYDLAWAILDQHERSTNVRLDFPTALELARAASLEARLADGFANIEGRLGQMRGSLDRVVDIAAERAR